MLHQDVDILWRQWIRAAFWWKASAEKLISLVHSWEFEDFTRRAAKLGSLEGDLDIAPRAHS